MEEISDLTAALLLVLLGYGFLHEIAARLLALLSVLGAGFAVAWPLHGPRSALDSFCKLLVPLTSCL